MIIHFRLEQNKAVRRMQIIAVGIESVLLKLGQRRPIVIFYDDMSVFYFILVSKTKS